VGTVAGAQLTPGVTQAQQASETVESRLTFREAASVIVNAESGTVTVRATSRQHERVAEFIEQVVGSAKRQVLIAATIVEVELSDQYQAGVDWSALARDGLGYSFVQSLIGGNFSATPGLFSLTYKNPNPAAGGSISSVINILSQFGKTRVLSSPLLMVLNNQTAVLKVTDNIVYFTIKAETSSLNQNTATTTFTSTQNVVPVGLIMNLTAQVSDNDLVTLNVRPTITSIIGSVQDPNPALRGTLPGTSIESLIPVTRTRELESILRVASGQTAVLGGLMEDSFVGKRNGLPNISRIPVLGDWFSYRDDKSVKKELVIFIRPQVVRNASTDGDLANYRRLLPSSEFFQDTRPPLPEFQQAISDLERGRAPASTPAPVVPDPPAPGSAR
jgi:general secretion pathway protein D